MIHPVWSLFVIRSLLVPNQWNWCNELLFQNKKMFCGYSDSFSLRWPIPRVCVKGDGQIKEQNLWSSHLRYLHVVLRNSAGTICRSTHKLNQKGRIPLGTIFSFLIRKKGTAWEFILIWMRTLKSQWCRESSLKYHLCASVLLGKLSTPRKGQACSGNSKSYQLFLRSPRIWFLV